MKPWRRRLPTIASIFILWHLAAGAVTPLVMHVLGLSSIAVSVKSGEAGPEVCEHHAMPGAICPMHSKPNAEPSDSPACAMVACGSVTGDPFALLTWNGLLEPAIELAEPLARSEQPVLARVLLLDLFVSPTTPPPRA
ncbi:MAG TPA: hypothetical protein VH702_01510 [Vicinamibacterales bacterium]